MEKFGGICFFDCFPILGPKLWWCAEISTQTSQKWQNVQTIFYIKWFLKKNVFSYTEGGCTYNIFPFEDFWILVKLHKFSFHFKLTYRQVCPDILYIRGYHSRYPCPVFPGKEGGYLEQIFLLGISLLKNFPALPAGGK